MGLPVLYIVLSSLVFSTQDTLSKLLVGGYSPFEIAWFRYTINLVILIPFMLRSRGRVLVTAKPWWQIARGLMIVGSSLLFMAGLGLLPIADATAINFASPLLITAFSIPLLGESVGPRRWAAVAIGFGGVLIIVRPGDSAVALPALLPFVSAVLWALGMVVTRRMKTTEPPLTTLCISTIVAVAVLSAMLPFVWRTPDPHAAFLLLLMGLVSILGQYFMILGFSRRAASTLAPFTYVQIIWSTLSGVVVFGAVPGLPTWIGGAIVVASGLYILHRERKLARAEASA